jgi:hypothetical protein
MNAPLLFRVAPPSRRCIRRHRGPTTLELPTRLFGVQWLNAGGMLEFYLPISLLIVVLYRHRRNFGVANTRDFLGSCEDIATELGI